MKNFKIFTLILITLMLNACNKIEEKKEYQNYEKVSTKTFLRNGAYTTIYANRFRARQGYWEENPLSKINIKDQSENNDDWNKYIELSPNINRFRGYFYYYLPDDIDKNQVEKIIVNVNYKGEKYRTQRWYWKIKNFDNNDWELLGNNSFAHEWRWSTHSWTKNSNEYIKSSNGLILIKIFSNNDYDVCDIDYLVVKVKLRNQSTAWYKPQPGTSFDWVLTNQPSPSSYSTDVVDVDGFETTSSYVRQLHNNGKKAIAYISVGSWENWRPDKNRFPSSVIGNNYDGWNGEKFLDIRQINVLRPIMHDRFVMAKNKGFDAIEPDNIDLHTYSSGELGFNITRQDVINYCQMLTNEAHSLGLSIGQKNAADLSSDMVDMFDWILLEDAYYEYFHNREHEAVNKAQIYIRNNKAVFATEYTDNVSHSMFQSRIVPKSRKLNNFVILKDRSLSSAGGETNE